VQCPETLEDLTRCLWAISQRTEQEHRRPKICTTERIYIYPERRHCEIKDERILCLFVFAQHRGPQKDWQAKDAWVKNIAVDQFGERHYKTAAFYLSKRGVRQDVMTLAPGDRLFLVQEFEAGDKAITRVNIISPYGQIRNLAIEMTW
jgi:hypothetical protein